MKRQKVNVGTYDREDASSSSRARAAWAEAWSGTHIHRAVLTDNTTKEGWKTVPVTWTSTNTNTTVNTTSPRVRTLP